jgi:hypothetical protein
MPGPTPAKPPGDHIPLGGFVLRSGLRTGEYFLV